MNVCPTTNSLLHSILWHRKKLICQSYHGFLSLTFGMSCNVTADSMNQFISFTTKTRFKLKGVTISTTHFLPSRFPCSRRVCFQSSLRVSKFQSIFPAGPHAFGFSLSYIQGEIFLFLHCAWMNSLLFRTKTDLFYVVKFPLYFIFLRVRYFNG